MIEMATENKNKRRRAAGGEPERMKSRKARTMRRQIGESDLSFVIDEGLEVREGFQRTVLNSRVEMREELGLSSA